MKRTSQHSQEPNLTKNKLALRMFGAHVSVKSARDAALRVAQHIPSPSVLEFLAQPFLKAHGATLCQTRPQMISSPTALFSELKLSVGEIPDEWMGFYADWMARLQRAHEFRIASLHLSCATNQIPTIADPIVAGLLLYLSSASADADTRVQWLEVAVKSPAGSWLAAEGLHSREESEQILSGVRSDSRFLWATSQISGVGRSAAKHARIHLDLYGGLTLAIVGDDGDCENWLRSTALAGCECADAASAALIFQPDATDRDKAVWLSTLKNSKHARYVYETVRLARHTWSPKEWNQLKNDLREYTVSDNSQWACHWFATVEPEHAAATLGGEDFDLLWATELLALTNVDDYAFRFRVAEKLGACSNSPAAIVLTWLNQHHSLKSNGNV